MTAASARPTPRRARALIQPALVLAAFALGATGALAQSCNEDVGAFQKKRNVHIETLNKMTKANKGKLDPLASCPQLRNLAAVEKEMAEYMQKNQSWCSIPDQIIEQVKTGSERTAQIAGQACKIAAQARKMQQQQQTLAPPPPALPRGPL